MAQTGNRLYYGDNLEILRRHIPDESVDLIYLDPPFNSNRSYNVLFKTKSGDEAQAQIEAFDDTWTWSQQSEAEYDELTQGGASPKVADAIEAMRKLLGHNDVLAYLVMMTARLLEMHRVLKPTGTIYLHCDPTASHYLKVVLDAVFGIRNFRNEIVWGYKYGGRGQRDFGKKHDIILRYSKTDRFTFRYDNPAVRIPPEPESLEANFRYTDEDGRRYREGTWTSGKKYRYYADEGRLRDDVWSDINSLHQADAERLGYPTQKPLALLELILEASSSLGEVVLDPFCGCGTTVDAAQKLGRSWIGIDISYLAVALIQNRLDDTYGPGIRRSYQVVGIPHDLAGAQALFNANAFDFERWAVTVIGGRANEKQVGDKGIDGVIRFPLDKRTVGRVLVSVKGGTMLNPAMVLDLRGTVEREKAEMGILVTLGPPTRGMIEEANRSGAYHYDLTGAAFPRLQIITVPEILAGRRPAGPAYFPPYTQAKRLIDDNQLAMFDIT